MGGDMGSFAQGFAGTLLKAQEQAKDREYKKALIEQSKLNTKLLENKVKLAEAEQSMKQGVMPYIQQALGGGQGQVMPAAGQPGMEQPQGGVSPFARGLAADMAIKIGMGEHGLDAGIRKQGNIARSATVMTQNGPMVRFYDQTGNVVREDPAVPEYGMQKIQDATGAEAVMPYRKDQPTPFVIKPPGIEPANIGRLNMVMQAQSKLGEVENLLMPDKKINRMVIAQATVPFGGIGKGSQLYSKMYQLVDSCLRIETGAQANATEIETKMREYWPSIKDTDETIKEKFRDLSEYANGVVKLGDPTGKIKEMRGQKPSLNLGKPNSREWTENGVRYKYDPTTGKTYMLKRSQ